MYEQKDAHYFAHARTEIASLIDFSPKARVLELGCGSGHTLHWLKQTQRCGWAAGIEAYAPRMDSNLIDEFFQSDAEEPLPALQHAQYDAILCLDVLEHLRDPWAVLTKLLARLAPGGQVIVSLPNIRNYKLVLNLLLKGQFKYQNDGILDRTHLRFFTRKSAEEMLQEAGLQVLAVHYPEMNRPAKRLMMALGWGDLLAKQMIFSCKALK